MTTTDAPPVVATGPPGRGGPGGPRGDGPRADAEGRDLLGLAAQRRRAALWTTGLGVALLVTVVIGVGAGPVGVSPGDSARIVLHHLVGLPGDVTWERRHDAIVWEIRAPRVVLGAAVGAGLALAGVVLQAMVRNILADPYVLGISSGASCGAAGAILFGVGAGFGDYALQGSAFVGALLASLLVFLVARSSGRITSVRLLMAGVAVGYALSAATSFLIFASDSAEGSRSVMFWLLGSLGLAAWNGALAVVVVVVAATVAVLAVVGRRLDALVVGDETALTLGVHPERFRTLLLVLVSLVVGVLVAMAGSIGFVGLVVPHLARRLVGGAHRAVVPVAALLGAVLLVWADVLARTLLAPQEIPIGIITALVGAPFLLLLVRRLHAVPS
ncbi:iron ABC transporter permease [Nocardioides sp. ChNu-153]|uniref:FecCD family ABC transporter permease n=1 Tax=Nocardioides sp. ChNu-153 TaxID=2779364 RepID=UPI002658D859|nr:iron ABC transporter permease [Nocardioides sp. ChNu-153]